MGGLFSSPSASQGASQGASTIASQGASKSASKKGPGPDLSKYTYATKSQLNAKINNGSFNPETDFAKMTVENTNPNILNTYGDIPDDVHKKLEARIYELFPDNKDEWGGGARKRRRKTRKVKGKKSRKHNKK
jgi:hypothetical protein